jgi:hypothetical protein
MITIGANGERIAYGIKHYNLDDESDLQKLPTTKEAMGCTCFIISTSKYYMLNSKKKWVEITPFGKIINSSGGDSGDTPGPDEPEIPDINDDIIYDGGII